MTKKNRIKLIGHTPELDFKISPGNPWETFFLTLKKHGYEIVEGENRKFDFLIVNSHSPKALRSAIKNGVNRANCVMIYWEPQVTNPLIYTEEVINSYGRVFSPSKTWNEKIGGFYFPWPLDPIPIEIESLENWKRRKNKCFLVAGNKFSVNKGNLYKLRRELAYDKNLQKDYLIDLYGKNWNKGLIFDVIQIIISFIKTPLGKWSYKSIGKFGYRYHNYKGEILDKRVIARNYKIHLVIENSSEYVSEKLFEALYSQGIIIYVGGSLEKELENDAMALICDPDLNSIRTQINKLKSLPEINQYELMVTQQNMAQKYLNSRGHKQVFEQLAKNIMNGFQNY